MRGFKFLSRLSLLPQGLRYKLLVAFGLMSIIPLLVIGYLVTNMAFGGEEISFAQASVLTLFCVLIAWLGLFLAKNITERVIDMAVESKIITEGFYDRRVPVQAEDEIGQIGEAINFLTKKIKSNIADLKDYQGKMKEINLEIQKKVSILSNILQISELISSSVELGSVLELILNKLSDLYEDGFSAMYFPDTENTFSLRYSHNLKDRALFPSAIEADGGILWKTIQKRKRAVVDASSRFSSREHQEFKAKYKCENVILHPMFISKSGGVLLIIGNNIKNYTFTNDDIELVKVFAEQISIAVENDILMKKAESLEIKDTHTNLFNRMYIMRCLEEEIKRSQVSQRPCSFIMLDIDKFKNYEKTKGKPQAEIALRRIAALISESSLPLGKAGRFEYDTFGVLLPEANKKEALGVAERIRENIEGLELSSEKGDSVTVSGGVSENPLDGSSADEIYQKAQNALGKAKEKGKNKIVSIGA